MKKEVQIAQEEIVIDDIDLSGCNESTKNAVCVQVERLGQVKKARVVRGALLVETDFRLLKDANLTGAVSMLKTRARQKAQAVLDDAKQPGRSRRRGLARR